MTKETRLYNGEKTVSSINGAGKTGQLHVKKNEIRTFFNTIKINSKWIKDLNVRPKTLKLLDDNIGEKLHNIRFDNDFLAMTPKHTGNKSKNR